MSDKIVAGVDLSGSKSAPHETWLVVGKLGTLGLDILEVKKTGSHALANELANHKALSTIGLDCPFSLPADFLSFLAGKRLKKDYQNWQEVVEELIFITFDEFVEIVKEYGKEPKRVTDETNGGGKSKSPTYSPLHKTNPAMVDLTYHGMRLLASLDPKRFFVVPFQDPIPLGCSVIEVSPRETLKFFSLPDTNYKGADEQAKEARHKILHTLIEIREKKGITYKDIPRLTVPKSLEHNFNNSEQALNALIACYTTGLYAANPKSFDDPFSADQIEVLLEGWTHRPHLNS